MRANEKAAFYAEMKSHYTMLQTKARAEYELCICMRAALDTEDEEEWHELTFRSNECYSEMLRHERALMYIEELQDREEKSE